VAGANKKFREKRHKKYPPKYLKYLSDAAKRPHVSLAEKRRRREDRLTESLKSRIKPKIRADRYNISRPCPFVSCRYNLTYEISKSGQLLSRYGAGVGPLDLPDGTTNCVLDEIDNRGRMSIEEVSEIMREPSIEIRRVSASAIRHLRIIDQ
jgi:hypothetical protein